MRLKRLHRETGAEQAARNREATIHPVVEHYREILRAFTAPGAPYEIVSESDDGTGAKRFANVPDRFWDMLAPHGERFADRVLVDDQDVRWTYAQVFAAAHRLGGALQDRYGIKPGDQVGIATHNAAEWFVAFFAVSLIGGVSVLFNSRCAPEELAAVERRMSCRLIVADARRLAMLRDAGCSKPAILIGERSTDPTVPCVGDLIGENAREATPAARSPEDPAAILFTSGTSGFPKGAVLSQGNLVSLFQNLKLVASAGLTITARTYGMTPEALAQLIPPVSLLLVFPLYHISGVTALLVTLNVGGMLTTVRRWEPEAALAKIAANKVTMLSGPPLVLLDLLDRPNAAERLATINNIGVGGQATPGNIIERVKSALPMAAQSSGWGMTEASGSVSAAAGIVFALRPNAAGIVSPLMDVRVVDDAGETVPTGDIGEIYVRGPLVMTGYWNDPQGTAAAMTEDGWFKSGDLGCLDEDGFIHIVDRKKDMVITGGENIYCAEVERVLSHFDGAVEVAVFGIPDERLGERAIAAMVLKDGVPRSQAAVQAYARQHLADYKVPSSVFFDLPTLPRNTLGKVDKNALKAAFLA